jgi:hypothetical protein
MPKRHARDEPISAHDAIVSMRTDYLQCRDFGHAWRPYTAAWSEIERAYVAQLRCSRCRTIRVRTISRTGAQLATHYVYPDGYLIAGLGRLTGSDRDELRLASIQQVLPIDTMEEAG